MKVIFILIIGCFAMHRHLMLGIGVVSGVYATSIIITMVIRVLIISIQRFRYERKTKLGKQC